MPPLTIAVVGAGDRGTDCARYALNFPERMKVVAVVEPDAFRRERLSRLHNIPVEMQFTSYEALAARPKLADAVINGTPDRVHYPSALPLLERGYHMLLEKPIARTEAEVRGLLTAAARQKCVVMICHVLRYAPFYAKVKELLAGGSLGRVISMRTSENVSYHHMAAAFIRGRWNNRERSNPMMLAKCCHDLDLIAWLFTGIAPARVASVGSLMQFRPENAPAGSAERCLCGCRIEDKCQYSARLNYITHPLWGSYAFEAIQHLPNPTVEDKLESLRTTNPYGRCVWHCDNDVVDHQSVLIEFAGGATATHDMFCAVARPCRTLHLIAEKGEIEGNMEAGWLVVRRPNLGAGETWTEETVKLDVQGDGHGGGDERLVADFVRVVRGESASPGVTRIEDSLTGHLLAFAADKSMNEQRVVAL
jgi:predicted dehydrogenase